VPAALALTAGITLDRNFGIPLPISLATFLAGLCAWLAASLGGQRVLALVYLAVMVAAFGAGYHHRFWYFYAEDDIGEFATEEPRPVKLRGVIAEEPIREIQPKQDVLQSFPRSEPSHSVLEVTHLHDRRRWQEVSGRARLTFFATPPDALGKRPLVLHVGDEVEVVGRLVKPLPPANPGEFDYASYLRDQHIRALVVVRKTPDGITLLAEGSAWSLWRALPLLRGWGRDTLQEALPEKTSGLAVALILGDGSQLERREWDKYLLTGVIHVLAISGQHLVILGGFLWFLFRVLGIRRRRVAWFVGLFLLTYALLAGGRPPVMRSAVMVSTLCFGLIIRRVTLSANSFALAWIVVLLLNPTDSCNSGCLLSFLSVAVLYWGFSRRTQPDPDPLEPLIQKSRPRWLNWLGRVLWPIGLSYLVGLAIWLALAPLVASRYHTVPIIGLVIGPPLVLLTSVALVTGFLLLLSAAIFWPLVPPLAWLTSLSLGACEWLVSTTVNWPGAYFYVGDVPDWWLWVYYPAFLAVLMLPELRKRWRWGLLAALAWVCIGLVSGWTRTNSDELRCTFLAVGRGGCAVLETPDGRTILYDAGAAGGPDVTRRQIAPFLWSRGIRRIDEVIISHADLDHFNGLPDLLERFSVGQVSVTPTFADKTTQAVRATLDAVERHQIPIRIVRAGDRLSAGDVSLQVLYPPADGPLGKENFRSLVVVVQHAGHALMLTGDLEGPGMALVQRLPPPRVDVLMAPHHGSRSTDTPGLARKVRPQIVIACQGAPQGATRPKKLKLLPNVPYWGTWPHGAITVHSGKKGLWVESYLTRQRMVLETRVGKGRR
jgi:competence protein ComEC